MLVTVTYRYRLFTFFERLHSAQSCFLEHWPIMSPPSVVLATFSCVNCELFCSHSHQSRQCHSFTPSSAAAALTTVMPYYMALQTASFSDTSQCRTAATILILQLSGTPILVDFLVCPHEIIPETVEKPFLVIFKG